MSDDARRESNRLIRRFALHQQVQGDFIRRMATGRDGRPLPKSVKKDEYWTEAEVNQRCAEACQAAGTTMAEWEAITAEIKTPHYIERLRHAGQSIGLTEAGLRQLETAASPWLLGS